MTPLVDPLLSGPIGLQEILVVVFKVVVAFAFLMVAVMFMVWFERKLIGDMQNRIGPNRAGPWGILQTLADGVKLFFKEDLLPDNADRFVFKLAPYLALIPAFLIFTVVPVGGNYSTGDGTVSLFGEETLLQVADPPVGVLFVLAMSSVAVYGVMLAGWSSGSKYPLLGSVRATAQMISYEAALSLSVLSVILLSGTLSTSGIVAEQSQWNWNLWLTGFIPFAIFLISGTAELNRPPFDLVEAEQELVGGFHTEYSAVRFALFFLAEFMNTVTMSAIIVTLFLGGPNGPMFGPEWLQSWVLPSLWFFLKLFVFLFVFVWFRATLPRFRYDQLMDMGWKLLIPAALGWFLILAGIQVASDNDDINLALVVIVGVAIFFAGMGLLMLAMRSSRRQRQLSGVTD
ncbi:MAG: NADH-quinone oxidoreductase subunit H [Acidimicrobiales bacterium]|nr:MAG: NADH-quinone oxidoreductase subunit NuoH [Actinomycetota bacterium]MBV6510323.1 NADH-quinone oxidoreductase subunit H [Acidimicrobiales bacterium]RIK07912.1 MAG: NADH-quinone oxidoreductase subunit NuoH [Acidobacteriota bacterium]